MKTEVNLYTVQVPGEYYDEVDSYIQGLYDAHPDKREEAGSWICSHYKPKNWAGVNEDDKWNDYAKENPKEVYDKYPRWSHFELEMDQHEFLEYCQHVRMPNITKSRVQKFTIPEHLIPNQLQYQTILMEQVLNLNDRCIEQLTKASTMCFNDKVGVPQPGLGLSQYNSLMLAEDICTDALQDYLDKGWRIIAVCPQPDQRRPDYILGRYNPDRDDKFVSGAERG